MQLRDYQKEAIEQIEAHYSFGTQKIVVNAPGGSGKTVLFAEIARKYQDEGVLILIQHSSLLFQAHELFMQLQIDHSVLKSGEDHLFDISKKVQIVMAQTLHKRNIVFKHKFNIVQIDEGHVAYTGDRIQNILSTLNPKMILLYSATPFDAKGFMLQDVDDQIVVSTVQELTQKGFLAPLKYYVAKWSQEIDYDKLDVVNGDYSSKDIDLLIGSDDYIKSVVETMLQLNLQNKKIAVFTNSIETADRINEALCKAGFKSFAYHSKSGKDAEIFMKHFKDNTPLDKNLFEDVIEPHKCVVSVSRISIGWNVPDLEAGVLCRPTKIRSLYYQMALRLTRTHPNKKEGIIVDLSGLIERLGFPDEDYVAPSYGNYEQLRKINKALQENMINYIIGENKISEVSKEKCKFALEEVSRKEHNIYELSIVELVHIFDSTASLYVAINIAYQIFYLKYGIGYSKEDILKVFDHLNQAIIDIPQYEDRLLRMFKKNLKNKVKQGYSIQSIIGLVDFIKDKPPYSFAYAAKEQRERDKDYVVEIDIDDIDEKIPF